VKDYFLLQFLEEEKTQNSAGADEKSKGEVSGAFRRQQDHGDDEDQQDSSCEQKEMRNMKNSSSVIITHSCRSIFYYIIKILLNDQYEEGKEEQECNCKGKGMPEFRIATHALHFGSFHRILRGMENSTNSNNSCKISFYEIDMKRKDWTMHESLIDEDELKKCNLILCQNFFGVPFEQTKLFELGRKYNIPILEDCVQSGSLFGKYKGDTRSDIIIYSGGVDKTPACFGAGFAYFAPSTLGQKLYKQCSVFHNALVTDSWKDRFMSCVSQIIHVEIAKNTLGSFSVFCALAYLWVSENGGVVQWDTIALKVRKNQSISPFQHSQAKFLRKPSLYQLKSILHGLSKKEYYGEIAKREIRGRDLLLSQIPQEYHSLLFPWLTPKVQQMHRDNMGISEFTWVVSPVGNRRDLCNFLNEHFVISMINTTWAYDSFTKAEVAKDITNNLIHLPNINQMKDAQIKYLGEVLTAYCQSRLKIA